MSNPSFIPDEEIRKQSILRWRHLNRELEISNAYLYESIASLEDQIRQQRRLRLELVSGNSEL